MLFQQCLQGRWGRWRRKYRGNARISTLANYEMGEWGAYKKDWRQ